MESQRKNGNPTGTKTESIDSIDWYSTDSIAERTPFVQRLDRIPTREQRLLGGFEHRYVITPALRPALEKVIAEDTEMRQTVAIVA